MKTDLVKIISCYFLHVLKWNVICVHSLIIHKCDFKESNVKYMICYVLISIGLYYLSTG